MLKTNIYNNKDEELLFDNTIEYKNGHCNSIQSLALKKQDYDSTNHNEEKIMLVSGDWDGGLCFWNVPPTDNNNDDDDDDDDEKSNKKAKVTNEKQKSKK